MHAPGVMHGSRGLADLVEEDASTCSETGSATGVLQVRPTCMHCPAADLSNGVIAIQQRRGLYRSGMHVAPCFRGRPDRPPCLCARPGDSDVWSDSTRTPTVRSSIGPYAQGHLASPATAMASPHRQGSPSMPTVAQGLHTGAGAANGLAGRRRPRSRHAHITPHVCNCSLCLSRCTWTQCQA